MYLLWDYNCSDTFAASYLPSTSTLPGSASEAAEKRQHKTYEFLQDRLIFVPVAQETTGVLREGGILFIQLIGQRLKEKTGEGRSTTFLFQRMSLALQR